MIEIKGVNLYDYRVIYCVGIYVPIVCRTDLYSMEIAGSVIPSRKRAAYRLLEISAIETVDIGL